MGSKFSILHTVMQLSSLSLITSYSSSFHPTNERSNRTWEIGLANKPLSTMASNSSQSSAIPPPLPPRVYAGRTTNGRPISLPNCRASSIEATVILGGSGSPISCRNCLKKSLSSDLRIVSRGVPKSLTLYFSSTPASDKATAKFKPVWPPNVGSNPSGRSRSITLSITFTVKGSI